MNWHWLIWRFESNISQEVVGCSFCYVGLSSSRSRIEHQEIVIHLLIHLHYACFVATPITVVWSWENCYDSFFMTPVVSIHHKLVSSCHKLQTIRVVEILRDVLTESETSSSWRDAPTMPVIWVRPQKITHRAFVRHFNLPINLPYLVKSVKIWRQPSVKTEDLILNHSCQRQKIK